MHPYNIPHGRKPTYLRVCANYRPHKVDPYRIQWTVGGNLIVYKGDTYTPNSNIIISKILFNSVIFTKSAKFLSIDLKDFYLGTPLLTPEYMLVPLSMIPQEIVDKYNILPLIHNNMVLAKITIGMYGLPQADCIACDKLRLYLVSGSYIPNSMIPGLFKHKTRPIHFCLVVDNSGVKYTSRDDANYLITHLSKAYKCTIDWGGKVFFGIHLN